MTARDNAETADLTLEVGRLREQLEALKLEHLGCKPLYSRRVLEAQLTEATALLARVDDALESDGPWLALQVQLRHWLASRAPAQPAAPTPETPEQVCERLGIDVPAWAADVRAKVAAAQPAAPREPTIGPDARHSVRPAAPTPLDALFGAVPDMPLEPAVPEPSAETVALDVAKYWVEKYDAAVRAHNSALDRAVAAEAQLAAVRSAVQTARTSDGNNPHWKGWEPILALLTPAPSPGADPGRGGK